MPRNYFTSLLTVSHSSRSNSWRVTTRDRRSRRLPCFSLLPRVPFVCCINHFFICIASALRCRHFTKPAFVVVVVSHFAFNTFSWTALFSLFFDPIKSLTFVDRSETNWVFDSPLSNHLIPFCTVHRPLTRVRNSPEPEPD